MYVVVLLLLIVSCYGELSPDEQVIRVMNDMDPDTAISRRHNYRDDCYGHPRSSRIIEFNGCNYPKLGRIGECSEICGWGTRKEYYWCDASVYTCNRPCFVKPCPHMKIIHDCRSFRNPEGLLTSSACTKTCGVGVVYEKYVWGSVCTRNCCCQPCKSGGGGITDGGGKSGAHGKAGSNGKVGSHGNDESHRQDGSHGKDGSPGGDKSNGGKGDGGSSGDGVPTSEVCPGLQVTPRQWNSKDVVRACTAPVVKRVTP